MRENQINGRKIINRIGGEAMQIVLNQNEVKKALGDYLKGKGVEELLGGDENFDIQLINDEKNREIRAEVIIFDNKESKEKLLLEKVANI